MPTAKTEVSESKSYIEPEQYGKILKQHHLIKLKCDEDDGWSYHLVSGDPDYHPIADDTIFMESSPKHYDGKKIRVQVHNNIKDDIEVTVIPGGGTAQKETITSKSHRTFVLRVNEDKESKTGSHYAKYEFSFAYNGKNYDPTFYIKSGRGT